MFLLGACALVDAFWAIVGDDLFGDVLGVLQPVLEDAVPGLDGQVAVDALIGAFAVHFDCDQPGNAALMARITSRGGNVLENLATAGAVPPSDVLPVGLTILSALAQLCRSDSASVLQWAT